MDWDRRNDIRGLQRRRSAQKIKNMASVTLKTRSIVDMASFHNQCVAVLGFPEFYGRNMNAWIDCLSTLTEESNGMSSFQLRSQEQLFISVPEFEEFSKRVPDVSAALLDCTSFVNRRYVEAGDIPRLVLVLQ